MVYPYLKNKELAVQFCLWPPIEKILKPTYLFEIFY